MKISDLTKRFKIGLFLFSVGDEVTEYVTEEAGIIAGFAKERYEKGKAMLELIVEKYKGSTFAKTTEVMRVECLSAMTESAGFEARVKEICGHLEVDEVDFLRDVIELAIDDPVTFQGYVDSFAVTEYKAVGIPDDYVQGRGVEASNVGWHMADQDSWREVWEMTDGGAGVLVVTCDTGTTPNHPDIPDQAFVMSVVPGEPSGVDGNFHGTHCQGTNTGQNGIGVAPDAVSASVQCLSAQGSGRSIWTAQAIQIGINQAIERNMPVVFSISIGGGGPDAATTAALLRASRLHETHGIPAIVCAAAGNAGYQGRPSTDWPSNDINAASIASYQENGLISGFSSGGPNVDMAFPGSNIVSANFRGGRALSSGTSMATPGAAGYAALMQAFLLKNGFNQLRNTTEFIAQSAELATDAGAPGEDARFGAGILEVFKVLRDKSPDDVNMLAVKPPVGKIATMLAVLLSMVFACGSCDSASAQEPPAEIRTVVETIEVTTVYFGERVISGPTQKTVDTKQEVKPASTFEFPGTEAYLLGTDLKFVKITALTPGVFQIDRPGKYLVFPTPFPEGVRQIELKAPEPEFDLSTVSPTAKRLADAVGDPDTRAKLAGVYEQAYRDLEGTELSFEAAGLLVKSRTLEVWPTRTGESRFADWVNGFQRPLQAELERLGFDDVETYRLALLEVVAGLRNK